MKLLSETEVKLGWGDLADRIHHPQPAAHKRSPGVHLSGVLRYVGITTGLLVPIAQTSNGSNQVDIDEEEFPLRMALGQFFEEGASGLYPDMSWQPGEMCKSGVYGTCDGMSYVDGQLVLEEFKLTWKSEWNYGGDKFIRANWMWMRQVMGYLAMWQDVCKDCITARFTICWVNGNYRPPAPKLSRYVVEFSQRDIDMCWDMIEANKNNPEIAREV